MVTSAPNKKYKKNKIKNKKGTEVFFPPLVKGYSSPQNVYLYFSYELAYTPMETRIHGFILFLSLS